MSQDGAPKDDVKVPEGEIGTQITSSFDDGKDLLVTIVSAMGEEQVSFTIPTFGLDVRL
jgi:translation initiation factor 5A